MFREKLEVLSCHIGVLKGRRRRKRRKKGRWSHLGRINSLKRKKGGPLVSSCRLPLPYCGPGCLRAYLRGPVQIQWIQTSPRTKHEALTSTQSQLSKNIWVSPAGHWASEAKMSKTSRHFYHTCPSSCHAWASETAQTWTAGASQPALSNWVNRVSCRGHTRMCHSLEVFTSRGKKMPFWIKQAFWVSLRSQLMAPAPSLLSSYVWNLLSGKWYPQTNGH